MRSICHYMDWTESAKESSDELTRESLIALSYCLPAQNHSPRPLPKKLNSGQTTQVINGDEAETHRSKLISISNKQSPDNKDKTASPQARKV